MHTHTHIYTVYKTYTYIRPCHVLLECSTQLHVTRQLSNRVGDNY